MFMRNRQVLLGSLGIVAFVIAMVLLIHFEDEASHQDFDHQVSTIRHYCGPEKASAFKALYDYNDHSSDISREWVMECLDR